MEALLLENWLQCPHPRDRFTTREYTFKRQVFSLIIDPTFNMAATKFYVAISATIGELCESLPYLGTGVYLARIYLGTGVYLARIYLG